MLVLWLQPLLGLRVGWDRARLRLWYVMVHGSDSIELSRVTVWSRFGLSLVLTSVGFLDVLRCFFGSLGTGPDGFGP